MTTNYIGGNRDKYLTLLRSMLSDSRFEHTLRTEKKALYLSSIYKESMANAQTAALLHDILKNISKEESAALAAKYNIKVYTGGDNLLHGQLASCYIKEELNITDIDVLNAVKNHTAGRAGMSKLEKIIYLADLIEDGRQFPGVDELRSIAENDLDKAVYTACKHTINYLTSIDAPILGGTLELYNEFTIKRKEGNI